jgi:hypothetical protein
MLGREVGEHRKMERLDLSKCNERRIFFSFLIPQQRYYDETRHKNDDTLMATTKKWPLLR